MPKKQITRRAIPLQKSQQKGRSLFLISRKILAIPGGILFVLSFWLAWISLFPGVDFTFGSQLSDENNLIFKTTLNNNNAVSISDVKIILIPDKIRTSNFIEIDSFAVVRRIDRIIGKRYNETFFKDIFPFKFNKGTNIVSGKIKIEIEYLFIFQKIHKSYKFNSYVDKNNRIFWVRE